MSSTLFVTATDIATWAQRLPARSQLPRLVRRLIRASAPGVQRFHFPADEGVQTGGWDGIVVGAHGDQFVPSGTSVWEMGVTSDVKGKADDDYTKRSQNPLGLAPKTTTFVFVTPRRWANKDIWVEARQAEGIWSDVRVFDAEDLETWLEGAPAVHLWLSMLMGKHPQGARALEDFWTDWAAKTNPAFTAELVIGGRTSSRTVVEEWLRGAPAVLAIKGDSGDEPLAFLSSVIDALEEPEREALLARAIVIEDGASWRELAVSSSSLLLVPRFTGQVEGITRAVRNGHYVFVALGQGATTGHVLPRIVRDAAEKALEAMGLPRDRASDLATMARRSFPALQRKMASEPDIQQPAWAQPQTARELLGPLLVGAWCDASKADRDVLARLAAVSYETLQENMVRWSKASDPPLRLVGGVWMVASPEDAWRLLAPFLTRDDLNRFREVALDVLGQRPLQNPSSLVERLGANTSDSTQPSGHLCEGVAGTLALMAALSSQVAFASSSSGEDVAQGVVRSLLAGTRDDVQMWASLARILPLLAEAAPTAFLDAIDKSLSSQNPLLVTLFDDVNRSAAFGGFSPHTYLLWALETLTWNPDFLGRAVLCLTQLASLDPGGKTLNRPANSLHQIFVVWYPNTTVSLSRRLEVLDAVRKRASDVAWRLMLGLLPTSYGSSTCQPTHSPKWHDWRPDEPRVVPDNEIFEAVEAIVQRLLSDCGANAGRWRDLIGRIADLWPSQRERTLEKLESLDSALFSSEERVSLGDVLRALVVRHREFPEADWTMPLEDIERLEDVGRKLEPQDPVLKHFWLFERFVRIAGLDFEERQEEVEKLRVQALDEILRSQDFDGVLRLAAEVEDPEGLGITLSAWPSLPADVDALLAENLASPESWRASLALGLIRSKAWHNDLVWTQARLDAGKNVWRPEQYGEFFLPFPFVPSTLEQVDALEEEAQRHFWSRIQNVGLLEQPQDAQHIVERLLWVGRASVAIKAIHWALHNAPNLVAPDQIAQVLEAAITSSSAAELTGTLYDSAQLFEHLSKTDIPQDRLARLEWLYFSLHEHTRSPKVLHGELARDPACFVEILSLLYRARPNEPEEGTREEDADDAPAPEPEVIDPEEAQLKAFLAERAWTLLWDWRQLPGLSEDGTLDENHLRTWIAQVREKAAEAGRSVMALEHIGKIFAFSPVEADGAWPHRVVRDLIEEIANEHLESGFYCQVFNNRGVTMRGLTDGGAQERTLAESYENHAKKLADAWPRTASVLRGLAQDYRRHAQREDESAALTQDFWR